jgi:hypothetical protein
MILPNLPNNSTAVPSSKLVNSSQPGDSILLPRIQLHADLCEFISIGSTLNLYLKVKRTSALDMVWSGILCGILVSDD